ncbi:MAG: DUF952 domain-containing protein [Acidimicrobiales bacterium]
MDRLFHIASLSDWEGAQPNKRYEQGLEADGFIHLSQRDQVLTPANLWYSGRQDLLLLVIDEALLLSEVLREPGTATTELFPHLYGPLNTEAVCQVFEFRPDDNGGFSHLPEGV